MTGNTLFLRGDNGTFRVEPIAENRLSITSEAPGSSHVVNFDRAAIVLVCDFLIEWLEEHEAEVPTRGAARADRDDASAGECASRWAPALMNGGNGP